MLSVVNGRCLVLYFELCTLSFVIGALSFVVELNSPSKEKELSTKLKAQSTNTDY